MGFIPAIRRQFGKLFHTFISRLRWIAIAKTAPSGELLQSGMKHAGPETMVEALMEVADLPELVFDPTGFDSLLKTA